MRMNSKACPRTRQKLETPARQADEKRRVSPRCRAATLSARAPWEIKVRTIKTTTSTTTVTMTAMTRARLSVIHRMGSESQAGGASPGLPSKSQGPPAEGLKLDEPMPPLIKNPKNQRKRLRSVI
jgi:hypothetical protein